MCTASAIFTLGPPVATSRRRTEEDIVRPPQLLRGGEPAFSVSPSSVRKSIWYWLPQTLTHSCSCESPFTHNTYPTHAIPYATFPAFPRACMPLPLSSSLFAHTLHMPFSIPPCGHLDCPCRGVGSISIFTPSPPRFHPSSQRYASFIFGAGWPIFSVWPHAAIVQRCSTLSCCSRTGPRQQLWVWQPGRIRMGTAGSDAHSEQSILAVWRTADFKTKVTKQNHVARSRRQRWRKRPEPVV